MRRFLSTLFTAALVVTTGACLAVPGAEAANSLQSASAARRIQRLALRKVSRTAPSTGRSTSLNVSVGERPSIRDIRRAAMRNAATERPDYLRPTRGLQRDDTSSSEPARGIPTGEISEAKLELLRLVNEVREENGLNALTYNTTLERAAQLYAEDMRNQNFFSHESPDGTTFDERIQKQGYPGPCPQPGCRIQLYLGENLAKGFSTPEAVLQGWMNSPGHKANILNEHFAEVGFGISGTYWAQEFGKVIYSN